MRGSFYTDDSAREFYGGLLYEGLLEVGYVEGLLDRFGQRGVRAYLSSRGFVGKLSTRVGDFGEVLAGALLQNEESLEQPIPKLRYREKATWNMRLTDVFALGIVDDRIESFCFASVKSGTTTPDPKVGVSGYAQLREDAQVEYPEIFWFVSEQLYRQSRFEEVTRLDDALLSVQPLPKRYRLILVFDSERWREEVLTLLDEGFEDGLLDFKTYLLTCPAMRDVVEVSYKIATDRSYGQ